jgi:ATP citrate (pro-S)-lyase
MVVKVSLPCRPAQVRVPTHVVSTICDDRGEEPTYAGVTMTSLMTGDFCIGDVISLLWFKRQLPQYATRFIEMCVMLCADHGPCVSGAPTSGTLSRPCKHQPPR